MKGYLKAGILGGLILFIWGVVSWMVLPWHASTFHKFNSEVAVAQIIQVNAPESGVYMLNPHAQDGEVQASATQVTPVLFATVNLMGPGSMPISLAISLVTQIAAAFLVAWLLTRTNRLSYGGRVGFVLIFALAAVIVRDIPAWNWLGFDAQYTLVNMADTLVGWFLAGLVLARYAVSQR